MDLLINGVPDRVREQLRAAVSATLAGSAADDGLSIVLTRLLSGEWMVFIADGTSLEVVDAALTRRIVGAAKEAELRMRESVSAEDRRLLEVIGRAHGHGPRRPLALLDIAWAETGSEDAGREALQRLENFGLIKLTAGTTRDVFGSLTDKGAQTVGI